MLWAEILWEKLTESMTWRGEAQSKLAKFGKEHIS